MKRMSTASTMRMTMNMSGDIQTHHGYLIWTATALVFHMMDPVRKNPKDHTDTMAVVPKNIKVLKEQLDKHKVHGVPIDSVFQGFDESLDKHEVHGVPTNWIF